MGPGLTSHELDSLTPGVHSEPLSSILQNTQRMRQIQHFLKPLFTSKIAMDNFGVVLFPASFCLRLSLSNFLTSMSHREMFSLSTVA